MLLKRAASKIELEEGWEEKMYKCPAGYLSVGFGFNLEAIKMPKPVAELWISIIITDINKKLVEVDGYSDLNEARKIVLIDMCYQMGFNGLMKFKNMWAAIRAQDFTRAKFEMLDSNWARQTPNRADRNSKAMESGEI